MNRSSHSTNSTNRSGFARRTLQSKIWSRRGTLPACFCCVFDTRIFSYMLVDAQPRTLSKLIISPCSNTRYQHNGLLSNPRPCKFTRGRRSGHITMHTEEFQSLFSPRNRQATAVRESCKLVLFVPPFCQRKVILGFAGNRGGCEGRPAVGSPIGGQG